MFERNRENSKEEIKERSSNTVKNVSQICIKYGQRGSKTKTNVTDVKGQSVIC